MQEPANSIDGNCPNCSSQDWRLAKMLVLGNVTNVDLNSRGGGFGITGGLGRGQGGAALNYQKHNLETSGTHTAGLALEYASPPQPSDYGSKDELFNDIVGTEVNVLIIGYACDGQNSGFLIKIPEEYMEYYLNYDEDY